MPNYSIPDFLDEDDIIHGDGGVIYVDNDIVTADYSVLGMGDSDPVGNNDIDDHHHNSDDHHNSEDHEDNFDSVIQHNDQLVSILQNSLEMQAYLFDKLLNFVF